MLFSLEKKLEEGLYIEKFEIDKNLIKNYKDYAYFNGKHVKLYYHVEGNIAYIYIVDYISKNEFDVYQTYCQCGRHNMKVESIGRFIKKWLNIDFLSTSQALTSDGSICLRSDCFDAPDKKIIELTEEYIKKQKIAIDKNFGEIDHKLFEEAPKYDKTSFPKYDKTRFA